MPSPPAAPGRLRPLELAVLALFVLSGASALIYEVVWTRRFTYVFGGSAFAVATVLAAFMAGLALGSALLGRFIDRRGRPLLVYALLEVGIALWATVLPVLLEASNVLYAALYRSLHPGFHAQSLLRFGLSFVLLLVPTTLMGGTLPVLGRFLLRGREGRGARAGLLYGGNTLGAVFGAAAGGFFLLPTLGLGGATWVAAGINLLVAAAAALLDRRRRPARATEDGETASASEEPRAPLALRRAVLIAYALSGLAALAYEVAWTKSLSLVLGSTTYAFAAMLTTFLLGLAAGSLVFSRLADRTGRSGSLLVLVQTTIPLLALLSVPWIERLPQLFLDGFPHVRGSWPLTEGFRLLLAGSVMILPTFLMGGMFPLATRTYVSGRNVASDLGLLYAANTVGAILGSFLAGFVSIPGIGRQHTILAATLVNVVAAGILFAAVGVRGLPRAHRVLLATLLLLFVPAWLVARKPWDPTALASGVYVYAPRMSSVKDEMKKYSLVLQKEDAEAIVSVWQSGAVRSLRINGKADAASHGDMVTQMLLGHLPGLYRLGKEGERGLVIGLATGISTGALLTQGLKEVASCELLPAMPAATHLFDAYNRRCLDDPRHRLILEDGRNHLLLTDTLYDVIVSEPTNPEIAGVGALFTREFFQLVRRRLRPDGILCQWTQLYHYRPDDVRALLGTIREVFPHVHIWEGSTSDLLIVASSSPLSIDAARLTEALNGPLGQDLGRAEILPVGQLLSYFVTDEAGIDAFVGGYPRRVTDANLLLEYASPRNVFAGDGLVTVLDLLPHARPIASFLTQGTPDLPAEIDRFRRAHALALRGYYTGAAASFPPASRSLLEQALALEPQELLARATLGNLLVQEGTRALEAGRGEDAFRILRQATEVGDRLNRTLALNNLGSLAFRAELPDQAEALWQRAAEEEPHPDVLYNLAMMASRRGDVGSVLGRLDEVLRLDPNHVPALVQQATYLAQVGRDLERAEASARRAVALSSELRPQTTLGFVLVRSRQFDEAKKLMDALLRRHPESLDGLLYLGMAQAGRGHAEEARAAFTKVAGEGKGQDVGRRAQEELRKL